MHSKKKGTKKPTPIPTQEYVKNLYGTSTSVRLRDNSSSLETLTAWQIIRSDVFFANARIESNIIIPMTYLADPIHICHSVGSDIL